MRITLLSKKRVRHSTGRVDVKARLNSCGFASVPPSSSANNSNFLGSLQCAKCFEQKVGLLYEIIS